MARGPKIAAVLAQSAGPFTKQSQAEISATWTGSAQAEVTGAWDLLRTALGKSAPLNLQSGRAKAMALRQIVR